MKQGSGNLSLLSRKPNNGEGQDVKINYSVEEADKNQSPRFTNI